MKEALHEEESNNEVQRRRSGRKSKPSKLFVEETSSSNGSLPPSAANRLNTSSDIPSASVGVSPPLSNCDFIDCFFRCETQRQMVCHWLNEHRGAKDNRPNQCFCLHCGVRAIGRGNLVLHKLLSHPQKRMKLYGEMLDERLHKSVGAVSTQESNQLVEEKEEKDQPNTEFTESAMSDLASPSVKQEPCEATGKVADEFKCSHCPFVCNQVIKLERHENKHLVKESNQVMRTSRSQPSINHLVLQLLVLLPVGGYSCSTHAGPHQQEQLRNRVYFNHWISNRNCTRAKGSEKESATAFLIYTAKKCEWIS